MDHGDDAGAPGEEAVELVHPEVAALVDWHHSQRGACLLAYELPRNDIRMVLHPGDEHLVAGLQGRASPRLGHQVDAIRAAPCEDDLAAVAGVDELLQQHAGALVGPRGTLAQEVRGAVDVRVARQVVVGERVDHGSRLLRRIGVVQVHERMAVHLLAQNREVRPDALGVERLLSRRCRCQSRHGSVCSDPCDTTPFGISARRVSSSRSRSGANLTWLMASPAKLRIRSARASARPSPRARR